LVRIAALTVTGAADLADAAATIEGMIDAIWPNAGTALSGATKIATPTIPAASGVARIDRKMRLDALYSNGVTAPTDVASDGPTSHGAQNRL
jgi:hypothetical protein